MPWIDGITWFDAHNSHPETSSLTKWQCLNLAMRLAEVLANLESQDLAHGNLNPDTVVIDRDFNCPSVNLVGVENLFGAHLVQEGLWLERIPEYCHRNESGPNLHTDRFPAALLIAEILCWHDIGIKEFFQSQEDSLFTVDELHDVHNAKFARLCESLEDHHSILAELLRRAWSSPSPAEAPAIKEWVANLDWVSRSKIEYAWLEPPAQKVPIRSVRCWEKPETVV
jgi:hypothetical protein